MMGDKVTEVLESYLLSKASIRALVFTQWETGSIGQLSTEKCQDLICMLTRSLWLLCRK